LFAASLVLMGYVALVLVQAKLYNADAEQYVNSALLERHTRINLQSERPPLESALSEGEILGRMEIPRLGVSAAVLQGTASRTLRLGVGHIRGTAIPGTPGNSAIAGHRDTFFRALKDIRDGDEIELKTADTSTRYLVIWARVVAPGDTSVLDATNESVLTLVTCYPFYFIGASPRRFVVRARKVPTATLDSSQGGSPAGANGPATAPEASASRPR
jgi:LPXTG-site transpeptidase (sortase) family protein